MLDFVGDSSSQTATVNDAPVEVIAQAALAPEALEPPTCIDPECGFDDQDHESATLENIINVRNAYRDCDERAAQEEIIRRCYYARMGYVSTSILSNQEKTVTVREVWRQERTLIAQMGKSLTWADQLFEYKARQEGFDEQAKAATAHVHDQLKRFGGRKQLRMAGILNSVMDGTGYGIVGWRQYKQTKEKLDSMHADGKKPWKKRTSYDVSEEAPFIQHISFWDFLCDPFVDEAKDSPMCFEERPISGADCKTLIRDGHMDADRVFDELSENGTPNGFSRNGAPFGFRQDDDRIVKDNTTVKFTRCWTFDGWEYWILNDRKIVRAMKTECGKIPIVTWKAQSIPGQHWGVPIALVMLGEQNLLNELMGMEVKSMRYSLVPLLKGTPNAIKAWRETRIAPGQGIALNNIAELEALELPDTHRGTGDLIARTLNNMSRTSGLPDVVGGVGTSGTNTASGLMSLQRAAGDRLEDMVKELQPGFEEAYAWYYNLNASNPRKNDPLTGKAYTVRIAGIDGSEVWAHYEDNLFEPDMDVETVIGTSQSIETANLRLNISKNLLGLPFINQMNLVEWIFEAVPGEKRPRRFIQSAEKMLTNIMQVIEGLKLTGIAPDAQPQENHQLWVQVLQMFMSSMDFGMLPPAAQHRTEGILAQHMQYLQQQMMANQQMQQAPGLIQEPGAAGPAQQMGNEMANSMIGMDNIGASQQGVGG